jgi:hypothetical protein
MTETQHILNWVGVAGCLTLIVYLMWQDIRAAYSLKWREQSKKEFEELFPGKCGECSWFRYGQERGWDPDPPPPHRCREADAMRKK